MPKRPRSQSRRLPIVVGVRMTTDQAEWMKARAEMRGMSTGAYLREAVAVMECVEWIVDRARKTSPSPTMHVYVADLERALGREAATPHKLGGNDGAER